jgi:uncharacterized membrane protein
MDELLIGNFVWMSWNVALAFIGVIASWFLVRFKMRSYWWGAALIWLLFVPNTIYMLTDIIHVPRQWIVIEGWSKILLLGQYIVLISLAYWTYWKSMRLSVPHILEVIKARLAFLAGRITELRLVLVINGLVAFAVIMGRVMRTNSWYVFTQPARVMDDAVAIVTSLELMVLVGLFWMMVNGIYYLGWKTAQAEPK